MKRCNYRSCVIILLIFLLFAFNAKAADIKSEDTSKNAEPSIFEIKNKVKEVLDNLIDSYTSKNTSRFMSFVAEDAAKDKVIYDRTIINKFHRYDDIELRYSLNNVTVDSTGKMVYVSLNFTRAFTVIKTTKRIVKRGTTELIFKMVDGKPMLYIMKKPSMF